MEWEWNGNGMGMEWEWNRNIHGNCLTHTMYDKMVRPA